jgi:hypothetical protein
VQKIFASSGGIKINVDKTNIVVFKKVGKLSRNEKWWPDRKK